MTSNIDDALALARAIGRADREAVDVLLDDLGITCSEKAASVPASGIRSIGGLEAICGPRRTFGAGRARTGGSEALGETRESGLLSSSRFG
jgi:hypothetical protein